MLVSTMNFQSSYLSKYKLREVDETRRTTSDLGFMERKNRAATHFIKSEDKAPLLDLKINTSQTIIGDGISL
jgi:hypothetical protein